MLNTYTQLHIQIVFAVKGREYLIGKEQKEEVHKYVTGIVSNKKCKLLAINCMPDHVHVFVGLNPDISISSLVRDIKANSSKFINENKWFRGKFAWLQGYGAFTYSRSQVPSVVKYVLEQEVHHKKKTFKEEYLDILQKADVDFEEKYLFEFYK